MIAALLIALVIIALNFLFYPFGLDVAALIFYSTFPSARRLLGIDGRVWMTGASVAGLVAVGICFALLFVPRAAAVEIMARWSLFSWTFGADQFIQARVDLRTVYANAFLCFAAPAMLPAFIWHYTHAGLRIYPFKNTTVNVEGPAFGFFVILLGGLLLKFHHMVMPFTPQVPSGLPRPRYYIPSLDVYADGGWTFFAVAAITLGAAMLMSVLPVLVRRILKTNAASRGTP